MNKDIAELEKALEALDGREEMMRYMVRHNPHAIAIFNCNLIYLAVSKGYLLDYQVKEEDLIGKYPSEVFPEMPERWKDIHQRCLAGELSGDEAGCFERLDGSIASNRWECRPWRHMNGETGGVISCAGHPTEQQDREMQLKEREEMMEYIVKHDPNAVAVFDSDLRYLAVSECYLRDYDIKEETIIGKHHYEVFPEIPPRWKAIHQRCLKGEVLSNEDDFFVRQDGSINYNRWVCKPWRRANGQIGGMITYTQVITKNKKAERTLKDNEAKYRYIFANNPQPMWIYDLETLAFLEVNDAAVAHYGYSREEFMHMTLVDIRPAEDLSLLYKNITDKASSENPPDGWRHRKKNGEIIYVEVAAHAVLFEGREARHILINDITRRKESEEKLLHMSRLYFMLSQINQTIIHTKSRDELLSEICRIAIDHGRFMLAWIGMMDETGEKLIPVARAGSDEGDSHPSSYRMGHHPIGQDPIGLAVQQGTIITSFDIESDPRTIQWRDQSLQKGYRSLAAVPVRCKNKTVGAFVLYAPTAGFFTDQEQQLLEEISEEVSFALTAMAIEQENKRAKEELTHSELRYQRLFESSKDGILLIDGDSGIVTDVNTALTDILGYACKELLGKTVWENLFLKQIVPDNAFFIDFQKTDQIPNSEITLQSSEGEVIHAEVVFNSYQVNQKKVIQCNLRNITQRKVAELKLKEALSDAQRFRTTLDHVSSHIYMKDLQSRYVYANKQTGEWFGCTGDELTGCDANQLFPPETAAYLRELDLRVFNGEEASKELVVNHSEKGRQVFLEVKVPIYTSEEDKTICGLLGISTDITERKLMEDRLKESEERFRTVAQSITDVIYEWDLKDGLDWYGDIDRLMDCLPGEFPRKFEAFKQMVHPDDVEPMMNSLEHMLAKGYPITLEYRVRKKNGEWCWWSARRTMVKDKNGTPIRIIGSITDITERTKARDELKFQADLLSNIGQAVVATDNQSTITYWNKAAEKMYGWTAAQTVGKNLMAITPAEVNLEMIQEITNSIRQGNSWSGELSVKRKDGSSFPVYMTNSPIYDSNGMFSGILNISSDITERKGSEMTLRKLSGAVEQTIDEVIITDREGTIEYINKAFEAITGYTPGEVIGKTPRILKSGIHPSAFYEAMWAAILSGKVYRAEMINKKKNGELYYVEKTISPIFDHHKNITHFVATGVDISARKQAEQELIKAKEKAEESDRLKSAFLANMSHEVRTPLNSIIGFSSLLADPDYDQDQKDEFISHIVKNGNALLSVISDIVDISKIEAGEITIRKSEVNLSKFINSIHQQFLYQAQERKLEFMLKLSDHEAQTMVSADPDRLAQVFINLISNAMKFTPHGKIEIGYQGNNHEVECYVRDTGIGIPKEYHEKIFDRFRQVEEERTRRYGGNGLGLAITKNLIGLMDGRIWLESEPGKGTTFYFTLNRMLK